MGDILDKIDRKLLYELDQNSRQNLNRIAKKLKIGRNAAKYRFERLMKKGIIKGTFTEINSMALGYYSFRILLQTGCCTKKEKENLIQHILANKNITWLSEVIGPYDLDLVYTTKNIFEFDAFRKDLFLEFNSSIEKHHISILTQIFHYPKDYLIHKKRKNIEKKGHFQETFTIDEIDAQILSLLAKNASRSILEISNKLDLCINTIKKRIQQLEKNKVILGYRLLLDTNKIGYYYFKLHVNLKNYTKQNLHTFQSFLESKNYVVYLDHYLGAEDFEIELHLKTEKEYLDFIEELRSHFGEIIKDYMLLKFSKEYHYQYLPG